MSKNKPLLSVRQLTTQFNTPAGIVPAVREVSFDLQDGETLGVVGESGSGKSVTALSILRLIHSPPGRIVKGSIEFNGVDLLQRDESYLQKIRGNSISMIFQEPMSSLNPLMKVGEQIAEVIKQHRQVSHAESIHQALEMLKKVQIPAPEKRLKDYPYQMSGGMRQRVMIAMALACQPKILIADEPTTALDVTIQCQIMDLIKGLKEETGSAVLMITHDLGVIAEMAQKVIVMYAGQVVESGDVYSIFDNPLHPYTQLLLRSIPVLGRRTRHRREKLQEIEGMVPNLLNLPRGCSFFNRCPQAQDQCRRQAVELREISPNRQVRCVIATA